MKFLLLFFLLPLSLFAQVPVDINSGNPAFPFPQFLAYESDSHSLGNLATQNAPGVTHAEMEQTIRDAWQIMMNRGEYTGDNIGGVDLIHFRSNPDVTEGDGYALLGASYMADKTTFDGLWMWTHENRMNSGSVRTLYYYSDGSEIPGTAYSACPGWLGTGTNCAFDGDTDIALALLMAYRNWGEHSGITVSGKDGVLKEMNYKEEALEFIRGLVEKVEGDNVGDDEYPSGSVGWDGYMKGGDTWGELTNWGFEQGVGPAEGPQNGLGGGGGVDQHIDYFSPSYFNAFIEFLEEENSAEDLPFNLSQLERGEASADWLMGKMLDDPITLPLAGWVGLDESNVPDYYNFNEGEDFRNPWRTILNYVWNGNPEKSWNPVTHQVEDGGNSYEKEIGERLAKFLRNPSAEPWGNECGTVGGGPSLTYSGTSQLKQYYDPDTGKELGTFPLNWLAGTGSPAAVAAQDFDLMGKLYRQCAIEWDVDEAGDGYLTSVPFYFHGWFRVLGMLVTSGNHHNPEKLALESNIKVYHKLDKTFAFTGDEIEITVSYRNYASIDATGVEISTVLPDGLSFVSASNGGTSAGSIVNWSIGSVPGFNSTTGVSATTGEVTLIVKVDEGFSGSLCNSFEITTSNGKGWTSNEFPNEQTAIMQRNCVDIVDKALEITKEVDNEEVNPGSVVTYQVDFENASSGGFINGGRPDVIVGYAHNGNEVESASQWVKIRLYHGAAEPYIDYGNYRISLFLNDSAATCVAGEDGCEGVAWALPSRVYEGGDPEAVSITSETIVPGSDERGSWNQRVIVKFSEQLATTTPHISRYFGIEGGRVHLGGAEPLRALWELHNTQFSTVNWGDDWSWNPQASDSDGGLYYPITNDFTDPNNPDVPVTIYHNEACERPAYTVDNVLVEEWDGFTWRRAFGNSPVPGRETENVLVKDVLPVGFTFVGFVDERGVDLGDTVTILGEPVTYDETTRTISWSKSLLQVKEGGSFRYKAIADFSSGTCTRADEEQINTASIEADNESPVIAEATVNITCEPVIIAPPESSMVKEVSPISAEVGDEVEYTLAYKNTDGSPFQSDFTEVWTVREGSAFTNNNGLSNTANATHISTNNFSHGTNGIIEATMLFHDNAQFGFALRYDGDLNTTGIANGYYLVFKPNSGSGNVQTTLYNGLSQVGDTDESSLKISSTLTTDIKIELIDEQINVWMGDTANPIPSLTFSGIEQRAGYIGVINGTPSGEDAYGVHTLTSFYSAMDSAFNVQMVDPVPGELAFVSSEVGVLADGVVSFPIEEGPVLADAEVSYTWTAEIISCPADLQAIENIAFTNIFGIPEGSIAAQAILDCSGEDLCGDIPDAPGLVNEEDTLVFSLNDPDPNIEDFIIIAPDHEIVWFDGPSKFDDEINTPEIDTSEEIEITYYVGQQVDNICGEGEIIAITVIVTSDEEPSCTTEAPEVTDAEYCLNEEITDTLDTYVAAEGTLVWYADNVSSTSINMPTINTSVAGTTSYYVSQVVDGCEGDRAEILVTIAEANAEVEIHSKIILNNESVNFDISLETGLDIGSFVWSAQNNSSVTGATMVASTGGIIADILTNSTDDEQEVVYTITSLDCKEASHVLTVIIKDLPSVIISSESVIEGDDFLIQLLFTSPTISETEITLSFTPDDNISEEDTSLEDLTVTVPIGVTDFVVTKPTIDDALSEQTESFIITVTDAAPENVTYDAASEEVSIIDNDGLPSILIDDLDVAEGESRPIDIRLSHPSSEDITIEVLLSFTNETTDNSDFELLSNDDLLTISFAAGSIEPISDVIISAIDDTIPEGDQVLLVFVDTVANGVLNDSTDTAFITIIDDDLEPTVAIDVQNVIEGEIVEIPIYLEDPALDRVELEISFNDIDTDGDFDTSTQIIVFEAGSRTPVSPLLVETFQDELVENDESFEVFISNVITGTINMPFAGLDTAIINIEDDDEEDTAVPVCTSLVVPLNGSTDVSTNLVSIAWEAVPEVIGYELTIGTSSGDSDIASEMLTTNSFNLSGSLVPNQIYYVSVIPFNVNGLAEDCAEYSFTTEGELAEDIPDCPEITDPQNGITNVDLRPFISWERITDADGYFLSVGTSIAANDLIDNLDVGNTTSYLISSNLDPETTYYVKVYPYNSTGTNNICDQQFFVTTFEEEAIVDETKLGLSPNGDGVNDVWEIHRIEEYPINEVYIYNRWGSLVYHINNYDNVFNVFKGEANQLVNSGAGTLPTGTYFYEIKISEEHNLGRLKGFIVLKR